MTESERRPRPRAPTHGASFFHCLFRYRRIDLSPPHFARFVLYVLISACLHVLQQLPCQGLHLVAIPTPEVRRCSSVRAASL